MKAIGAFKTWPRWMHAVVALAALGAVALFDYATGPDYRFGIFYFLPIFLSTWFFGRRAGYLMALAATLTIMGLDVMAGRAQGHWAITIWNTGMRLAIFSVIAALVHVKKQLGMRIDELVGEQTQALRSEVADRKRAEDAIHHLAAQLSEVEDQERRRLAHDIHDTLGQTLTVIKMNLQASMEKCTDLAQMRRLQESLEHIETMIKQTRTLIFELYPAMLEHLGLVPTVRRHAEQFKAQTGILITVSEMGAVQPLSSHAMNYLFRAIKELINNAAKHGRALEMMVAVHWRSPATLAEKGGVRVVVDDDGAGFDVARAMEPAITRGLGLASISERLMSLGGKMYIESAPGKGTRCILELATDGMPPAAVKEAQS